jgi:hypothetical protein
MSRLNQKSQHEFKHFIYSQILFLLCFRNYSCSRKASDKTECINFTPAVGTKTENLLSGQSVYSINVIVIELSLNDITVSFNAQIYGSTVIASLSMVPSHIITKINIIS